ncbi:hypothetical protein K402DRAFT_421875 [Aulographum hederae CBS 113979]|uniref:protein-histidine N-methyltransferase n=1 Tax=Aulographum hederae CBS 113979 TaxID=1176131 RepID=A0A6G1GXR9_9PEZI|nr:hypothetical protein K402DRAFT_421875 [Aulographum hederae CBS 113979]
MAAPFTFGFGDEEDEEMGGDGAAVSRIVGGDAPAVRAQSHKLDDLLSSLPSKISFSSTTLESPKGRTFTLFRRELFDIRMQLMAEEDTDSSALPGLDSSDIKTNIYEGGFKSWECSLDLARLLLDRGPRKDLDDLCRVDHVVELGCGTAIPTQILWHYALTEGLSLYFTLTDYNSSVLRLVTLPNLILTWASTLPANSAPFSPSSPNPLLQTSSSGDLELTPELLHAFKKRLQEQNIPLTLISGSWTPLAPFLSLIPGSSHADEMNTLILASETIYSPASLASFTDTLVGLLKRARMCKGMVAAKRVYFGVGGSVDQFRVEASERGAVACEIDNTHFPREESGGVARWLGEVQMM